MLVLKLVNPNLSPGPFVLAQPDTATGNQTSTSPAFLNAPLSHLSNTPLQIPRRPVQIPLRNHQRRREGEHVAEGDFEAEAGFEARG